MTTQLYGALVHVKYAGFVQLTKNQLGAHIHTIALHEVQHVQHTIQARFLIRRLGMDGCIAQEGALVHSVLCLCECHP